MIHVVVDANCLAWGWGGIPKVVDRVVRELALRDDVRVDLLANTRRPFARIPGTREAHARVKGTALWRETFVPRWLERERPSVYWAPESVLPRRLRVPAVVTIHDLAPLLLPEVKPWRHRRAFRTAVRRSARAADRVVAVSKTTAADAVRLYGLSPARVVVVPNGIDDSFTPTGSGEETTRVRERYGLDGPFVLAVGSLEPRKGLDVLVEAAALARARGLTWHVVLAGSTGFRGEAIAARAAATPGCAVLGPVGEDELPALYRAADVLAAPSLYEGFGLTPLEAMACGTPAVVAGGSGGLVEIAAPAGAAVVGERTPHAWVEAIERVRAEQPPSPRLDEYRWPAVAVRLLEVLRDAAAR